STFEASQYVVGVVTPESVPWAVVCRESSLSSLSASATSGRQSCRSAILSHPGEESNLGPVGDWLTSNLRLNEAPSIRAPPSLELPSLTRRCLCMVAGPDLITTP